MTPCHRPSQNPATCGASTCATLFGPAAQATRASAVTASTATAVVLHFVILITPRYPPKAYRGEKGRPKGPASAGPSADDAKDHTAPVQHRYDSDPTGPGHGSRSGLRPGAVVLAPDQPVHPAQARDGAHAGDERHQYQQHAEHHHQRPDLGVGVVGRGERRDLVPEGVEPEPGLARVPAGLVHHA